MCKIVIIRENPEEAPELRQEPEGKKKVKLTVSASEADASEKERR